LSKLAVLGVDHDDVGDVVDIRGTQRSGCAGDRAVATIGSSKTHSFYMTDPPPEKTQTAFLPRRSPIQIARCFRFVNLHA
jgi:hypothetical protein